MPITPKNKVETDDTHGFKTKLESNVESPEIPTNLKFADIPLYTPTLNHLERSRSPDPRKMTTPEPGVTRSRTAQRLGDWSSDSEDESVDKIYYKLSEGEESETESSIFRSNINSSNVGVSISDMDESQKIKSDTDAFYNKSFASNNKNCNTNYTKEMNKEDDEDDSISDDVHVYHKLQESPVSSRVFFEDLK
ncbi:hypothetical protein AB6A40_009559 [Gnathostoma spinigerum]|uniref:Uncharacterized protein n=1 Tax=Gnathostoma spinigerum TaxID=75299 RepID=A0ABD6ESB3_9BILA